MGVLFDKDGTLFDFHATWGAWTGGLLLRLAGGDHARADILARAVGYCYQTRSFASDSPIIAGTPGEIAECLLPYLPGTTPFALITRMNASAATAPQVEAAPLIPMLGRLRAQGMRLGVVTNDAESPARAHLQKAGVADLFDFIAGFDSGFGAKPQPGQLIAFADRMGLDPADVLMVGDSRHDMLAARAAGMRRIGVLTGLATYDDLSSLAEVVLDHVGLLPAWMNDQTKTETAA
ncbi:HAD family hydrolase [Parasulfitobacter algicola]|uniref:phosphoglycolate phosphatase n=1 Tax=Parasulfitobacter algicola TaxID=2614809 RepID=A0ABX2IQ00_9RHOB|nr:HAD family hydrolase [Sulfitobacter algicola]NSX54630.1 HAD family hydrolase [Sulfitobacter algicola]